MVPLFVIYLCYAVAILSFIVFAKMLYSNYKQIERIKNDTELPDKNIEEKINNIKNQNASHFWGFLGALFAILGIVLQVSCNNEPNKPPEINQTIPETQTVIISEAETPSLEEESTVIKEDVVTTAPPIQETTLSNTVPLETKIIDVSDNNIYKNSILEHSFTSEYMVRYVLHSKYNNNYIFEFNIDDVNKCYGMDICDASNKKIFEYEFDQSNELLSYKLEKNKDYNIYVYPIQQLPHYSIGITFPDSDEIE